MVTIKSEREIELMREAVSLLMMKWSMESQVSTAI